MGKCLQTLNVDLNVDGLTVSAARDMYHVLTDTCASLPWTMRGMRVSFFIAIKVILRFRIQMNAYLFITYYIEYSPWSDDDIKLEISDVCLRK